MKEVLQKTLSSGRHWLVNMSH